MRPLHDVACGDWLLRRAGAWARVGGVAGTGFEAYARILHPIAARRVDLSVQDEWGIHLERETASWPWAEVARRNDRVMHPLVQWQAITDQEQSLDYSDGWQAGQSEEGRLAPDLLAALTGHLAAATATPEDLVAAFWVGHGELNGSSSGYILLTSEEEEFDEEEESGEGWEAPPRPPRRLPVSAAVRALVDRGPYFRWPGREMVLLGTGATELSDPGWGETSGLGGREGDPAPVSPQLLWPAGHEWVLASEIDWDSTIVAGPRALVDAVLADDRVEAFEVGADADLTWDGDTVNTPRHR